MAVRGDGAARGGSKRRQQLRRRRISAGSARCLVISLTEAHAVGRPGSRTGRSMQAVCQPGVSWSDVHMRI